MVVRARTIDRISIVLLASRISKGGGAKRGLWDPMPFYNQLREFRHTRREGFASEFGPRFYGLPLNEGTITLHREPRLLRNTRHLR